MKKPVVVTVIDVGEIERELADRIESMMDSGEIADSPARRRELAKVRKAMAAGFKAIRATRARN